jgi:tetratricopeptide (TPR) repeat protein
MIRKKWIILILAVLALLGLGLPTWPSLRALRLRATAGRLLDEYIRTHAGEHQDHFVCLLPLLTDLPADPQLEEATALLEKARDLQPALQHTHYLLGQAYCLGEHFPEAVKALGDYVEMRPDNPLGQLSLAFAHFSWGNLAEDLTKAEKLSTLDQALLRLESINFTRESLLTKAKEAFIRESYPASWLWFSISNTFRALHGEDAFQKTILDVIYQPGDKAAVDENLVVEVGKDPIIIRPFQFFRLASGDPVSTHMISGQEAAFYYQNTDDGGIFFNVAESGEYCLRIDALDNPPAPTYIGISYDFSPVTILELSEGNNSWKTFTLSLNMESGVHLLALDLENDAWINGIDRNAYIGEIRLFYCDD